MNRSRWSDSVDNLAEQAAHIEVLKLQQQSKALTRYHSFSAGTCRTLMAKRAWMRISKKD